MCAPTVAKALARRPASYRISDFTLERLPLCVPSVENPVRTSPVSLTTGEFTQERNPIPAVTAGRPLEISRALIATGELIQERGPTDALTVEKLSPTCHASFIIRECCMRERKTHVRSRWGILSQRATAHHIQVIAHRRKTLLIRWTCLL